MREQLDSLQGVDDLKKDFDSLENLIVNAIIAAGVYTLNFPPEKGLEKEEDFAI